MGNWIRIWANSGWQLAPVICSIIQKYNLWQKFEQMFFIGFSFWQSAENITEEFRSRFDIRGKNCLLRITDVLKVPETITFTNQLNIKTGKPGSDWVAIHLLTFLQSIQQFIFVVNSFVFSNPAIKVLLRGNVKFAVFVSRHHYWTHWRTGICFWIRLSDEAFLRMQEPR